MEKQQQTLLNASYFFYGCAVLDIIQLIRSIANGAFKFDANVAGVSETTGNTVVVITVIILMAIGPIIKLYLAVKGVRQAYGKSTGFGSIKWAKVVLVLLVIGIIGTIVNVAQGTDHWYTLVSPVASLIAAYFYVKAATALRG